MSPLCEGLHRLWRGGPEDLGGMPQLLGAFAELVEVLLGAIFARGDERTAATPVGAFEAAAERGEIVLQAPCGDPSARSSQLLDDRLPGGDPLAQAQLGRLGVLHEHGTAEAAPAGRDLTPGGRPPRG